MDFEPGWAILAGLIGGGAMAAILYMGIFMLPNQMKMNLFKLLGTMMVPAGAMAYVAGAMMHGVMSIVFGIIHASAYAAFGLETGLIAWGLLFGVVHWMVVGMGLGMMPTMHPAIRRGDMQAPGAYAMSYPRMTAMGFFMLHLVFGVVMAAVYEAIV